MAAPFYAKDFSAETRTFLYVCAFWTLAADEEITAAEQDWLIEQFGEDGVTESLDKYVALENSAFLKAFDNAVRALPEAEKRDIYPRLEEWLISCAEVEPPADEELKMIAKIEKRLSLETEIRRLTSDTETTDDVQDDIEGTADAGKSDDTAQILKGHNAEVTSLDVSPDGLYILSGSEDCTVKCWDFTNRNEIRTFEGHEIGVTCVRFCAGGRRAITGDRMASFRMWDIESGDLLWSHCQKHSGGATGADMSPDGKRIVTCCDVGTLSFMRADDGTEGTTFGEKKRGALHAVCFSPDGKWILTGGDDKLARLWDAEKCAEIRAFRGHSDGVMSVCFNPDGRFIATGGRDNCVKIWDTTSGKMIRNLPGHSFSVMGVSWSSDGRYLLSASWDHTMKVWDVQSGHQMFNLETTGSRFSCAVFHPDGTHIVAGCSDKSVYVVRLALP